MKFRTVLTTCSIFLASMVGVGGLDARLVSAPEIPAENDGVGDTAVTSTATPERYAPSSNNPDSPNSLPSKEMSIESSSYGETTDGDQVTLYTCRNSRGTTMKLIDYGATMVEFSIADRDGDMDNIILTCPDMEAWQQCGSYFGCIAGRFCNRIREGRFSLDGTEYTLATNNEPNHLHGGDRGFDKRMWQGEPVEQENAVGVRFTRVSPDGEEGYPGTLTAVATILLTEDDELHIELRATTDKATPVNLTNHNYWNLGGHQSGPITDHHLQVNADQFLEADDTLIPTGQRLNVVNTPLDFRQARPVGEQLDDVGGDVKGYDHCFVVRGFDGAMRSVATLHDPSSGRTMEILSTQPGLQFYTGNFLDESPGSGGYAQYNGICLETQHFPDSPNQESFPNTILQPGDEYVETTIHRFSTR